MCEHVSTVLRQTWKNVYLSFKYHFFCKRYKMFCFLTTRDEIMSMRPMLSCRRYFSDLLVSGKHFQDVFSCVFPLSHCPLGNGTLHAHCKQITAPINYPSIYKTDSFQLPTGWKSNIMLYWTYKINSTRTWIDNMSFPLLALFPSSYYDVSR